MGHAGGKGVAPWVRRVAAAFLCISLAAPCCRVLAQERVAVVAVTPGALDSNLVCDVDTRGLPDGPSRETLSSGLPSALVLGLSVLDAAGKTLGDSRAEVHVEPDLWEGGFVVSTPGRDHRLTSMGQVEALLGHLPSIPALPLERLDRNAAYRIRVRLAVHPLAPAAIRRSRSLFTGEGETADADRREVAVGFDAILRFFLGKTDGERWTAEATSRPFTRRDLPGAGPPRAPNEKD